MSVSNTANKFRRAQNKITVTTATTLASAQLKGGLSRIVVTGAGSTVTFPTPVGADDYDLIIVQAANNTGAVLALTGNTANDLHVTMGPHEAAIVTSDGSYWYTVAQAAQVS
jgi:hypothetical protein